MALLSLTFLGLTLAVEAFLSTGKITESDGIIEIVTKTGVEILVGIASIVAGALEFLFGLDLGGLHPSTFFFVTYTVIVSYAIWLGGRVKFVVIRCVCFRIGSGVMLWGLIHDRFLGTSDLGRGNGKYCC